MVAVVPFHVQYFACQSDIDLNFDGDGGKSAILVVGAYSNITCWVGDNNTRSLVFSRT